MASEKECIAAYFESFSDDDCLRYTHKYGRSWDKDETVSKECIAAYFESFSNDDCLRYARKYGCSFDKNEYGCSLDKNETVHVVKHM